jgi:hypothetical protein
MLTATEEQKNGILEDYGFKELMLLLECMA